MVVQGNGQLVMLADRQTNRREVSTSETPPCAHLPCCPLGNQPPPAPLPLPHLSQKVFDGSTDGSAGAAPPARGSQSRTCFGLRRTAALNHVALVKHNAVL